MYDSGCEWMHVQHALGNIDQYLHDFRAPLFLFLGASTRVGRPVQQLPQVPILYKLRHQHGRPQADALKSHQIFMLQ